MVYRKGYFNGNEKMALIKLSKYLSKKFFLFLLKSFFSGKCKYVVFRIYVSFCKENSERESFEFKNGERV